MTKPKVRVTVEQLEGMGACRSQRATFEQIFHNGCIVSLKTVRKAQQVGLDLDWFAAGFFGYVDYDNFKKATRDACAKFDAVRGEANDVYDEKVGSVKEENTDAWHTVQEEASKVYFATIRAAGNTSREEIAKAFVEGYWRTVAIRNGGSK